MIIMILYPKRTIMALLGNIFQDKSARNLLKSFISPPGEVFLPNFGEILNKKGSEVKA